MCQVWLFYSEQSVYEYVYKRDWRAVGICVFITESSSLSLCMFVWMDVGGKDSGVINSRGRPKQASNLWVTSGRGALLQWGWMWLKTATWSVMNELSIPELLNPLFLGRNAAEVSAMPALGFWQYLVRYVQYVRPDSNISWTISFVKCFNWTDHHESC